MIKFRGYTKDYDRWAFGDLNYLKNIEAKINASYIATGLGRTYHQVFFRISRNVYNH